MNSSGKPLSDRILDRIKNKPWVAWIIVFGVILGALATFTDSISKLHYLWVNFRYKEKIDLIGKWNETEAWKIVNSIMRSIEQSEPNRFGYDTGECNLQHSLIGVYFLKYKNKESMLMALESSDGISCHACSPDLSFFEFERHNKGWNISNKDVAVFKWGAWGEFDPRERYPVEASSLSAIVLGEDVYGIVIEGGSMGQGYWSAYTTIYSKVGDSFKKVMFLETAEDDGGSGNFQNDWRSKIEIVERETGFFDLVLEKDGIRDGKEFSEKTLYKFDGSEYIVSSLFK